MTNAKQDTDFGNEMIDYVILKFNPAMLNAATEWVSKNLNPDDVFSEKDLQAWAEANGYVKE